MKKRKFNDITKIIKIKSENRKLIIIKIDKIPCMACGIDVYYYKLCRYHVIYCSYDCFSILMLSNKQGYLDENNENSSFNDSDDLMTS